MSAAWLRDVVGERALDGGYRLARAANAGGGVRVTFTRGADALTFVLTPRDDRAPRAAATRHWNVICASVDEGTLARPAERAYHDFVARLRNREQAPIRAKPPALDGAARRLVDGLASLARVPRDDPRWRAHARWISTPGAARRHARAIRDGALGFDLALSARAGSWRAGITINTRAVPDLARRAAALVDPAQARAAHAAIALTALPDVELTVGVSADANGAKLKLYAQETRHGLAPIDRRALAPLAAIAGVDPRRLPARVAVACLDLPIALKVYTHDPPRAALAFARDARRAGGNVYFTTRFAAGRSRLAANAVFRVHRPPLRSRALALARRLVPASVDALLALAADRPIAITALGLDLDGPEADVYFTPIEV